ncbi:hypothetical protein BATDEDRAFT_11594, partial [Batrachochytrium dendrobatidis JAM81]
MEVTLRKAQGLLNKLTIENFEKLSEKILNIGFDNQEIIDAIVSLIYEKALDQSTFAPMYAKLCDFLLNRLPSVQLWMNKAHKFNEFRRGIVKSCQQEFESQQKWAITDQSLQAERAEKRRNIENLTSEERQRIADEDYEIAKIKRRSLGNIKFIGELYMTPNKVIAINIIRRCIEGLMWPSKGEPDEEELESLCKLITTVGKALEYESSTVSKNDSTSVKSMNEYMQGLKQISKRQGLSSRVEFMILDVIDL